MSKSLHTSSIIVSSMHLDTIFNDEYPLLPQRERSDEEAARVCWRHKHQHWETRYSWSCFEIRLAWRESTWKVCFFFPHHLITFKIYCPSQKSQIVVSCRLTLSFDEASAGVACNLDSRGFHVLCKATEEVVGHVKPYSITGTLPLIRDLKVKPLLLFSVDSRLALPSHCSL